MTDKQPLLLQSELDQQRRQVDVDNYDLTLGEIVRMAEADELIRAPEYQRKFRWTEDDESYLIESLLLGLPVPSIYVASNPDGTLGSCGWSAALVYPYSLHVDSRGIVETTRETRTAPLD